MHTCVCAPRLQRESCAPLRFFRTIDTCESVPYAHPRSGAMSANVSRGGCPTSRVIVNAFPGSLATSGLLQTRPASTFACAERPRTLVRRAYSSESGSRERALRPLPERQRTRTCPAPSRWTNRNAIACIPRASLTTVHSRVRSTLRRLHWQQPGTRPAALPLPAQLLRARLFCPPLHEANHRKCTPNVTNHEGSDSKCVPVWLPHEVTVFNAPSIAHAAAAQVPVTASPTASSIDACEGPSPGFSCTTLSLLFLLGVRLRATRVSTLMCCCADWLAGRHTSNRS